MIWVVAAVALLTAAGVAAVWDAARHLDDGVFAWEGDDDDNYD